MTAQSGRNQRNRVQLILADLAEYEGSGESVLLDKSCETVSGEYVFVSLNDSDAEAIVSASRYCSEIYELLLPLVAKTLNSHLGITVSDNGYRLILGNWVRNFIEAVHYRFKRLDKAFAEFPNLHVADSSEESNLVTDYKDFQSKLQTPKYNRTLLKQILHTAFSDQINISFPSLPHSTRVSKDFSTRGDRLLRFLREIISRFSHKYVLISDATLPYFNKYRVLRLLMKGRAYYAIDNLRFKFEKTVPTNHQFRDTPLAYPTGIPPNQFLDLLAILVPRNIPIFFLESMSDLIQMVNRARLERVMAVYTNFGIHHNPFLKLYLALNENKIPVIAHQHGGRYCIDAIHLPFQYEQEVASDIMLWGEDSRGVYLPSLKLKTGRRRGKPDRSILLGVSDYSRYHQRYLLKPQLGSYALSDYANGTARFIQLISDELPVTVRSSMPSSPLRRLKGVTWQNPHDVSFDKEIVRHSIYCVDHLGTTMLESISLGIPTIAFIDPNITRYHELAFDVMLGLEHAGLIHSSPDSAARFLKTQLESVESWWNSEKVQAAVQLFSQRFALPSNRADDHLASFLRTYAQQS